MVESWEINLTERAGRLVSLYFDTAYAKTAPVRDHGVLARVAIRLREPDGRGMSTNAEYPRLIAFEDSFVPAMAANGEAIFVGRFTTGGQRIFFFYGTGEAPLRRLAERSAAGQAYPVEISTEADPTWSFYREQILPTADENQRIQNRKVFEALRQAGDQLTAPRKIDHTGYFQSRQARDVYAARVEANSFSTRRYESDAKQDRRFVLEFSRVEAPENIDDVVVAIFRDITSHGGEYDGWGCVPVRPQKPALPWSMSGKIQ